MRNVDITQLENYVSTKAVHFYTNTTMKKLVK